MSISKRDLLDLSAKAQMDLRAVQAKLTELRAWLVSLPLPEERTPFVCPRCGVDRGTERLLAEHLRNVHEEDT